MEKVLVSSCLLGDPVRWNGAHKRCDDEVLQQWMREGRVVQVCPELAGGLPVPRPPAEVSGGSGGTAVLRKIAKVMDSNGIDVTGPFVAGAEQALLLARTNGIRVAILKEGSPSCGSAYSYDGTFSGRRIPEPGVTAAHLRENGVYVFSENQLAEADALLRELEARPSLRAK